MLKGAIWIVCLFVEVLKELGTESFVHDGYVSMLSMLLFVSYSGLGFALAGLGPSGWCRRARAIAARFAPSKKWKKEKMEKNDEKRKKNEKHGFTRKILDDFHGFVSECLFPEENRQPVLPGRRFSEEK